MKRPWQKAVAEFFYIDICHVIVDYLFGHDIRDALHYWLESFLRRKTMIPLTVQVVDNDEEKTYQHILYAAHFIIYVERPPDVPESKFIHYKDNTFMVQNVKKQLEDIKADTFQSIIITCESNCFDEWKIYQDLIRPRLQHDIRLVILSDLISSEMIYSTHDPVQGLGIYINVPL